MNLILITGASGSGKTTLAKSLQEQNIGSVYYFDDIGVPSMEEMVARYGSPEKWQEFATHNWINRLSKESGNIILEGSFNPEFAFYKLTELNITNYQIICLHTYRQIREQRLIKERNQPELANDDMENCALVLKEKTLKVGGIVIDSGNRSVAELVEEIREIINDK